MRILSKKGLLCGVALVSLMAYSSNVYAAIEEGENNSVIITETHTFKEVPSASTIYNNGSLHFDIDTGDVNSDIVNSANNSITEKDANHLIFKGNVTNSGMLDIFHLDGYVTNNVGGTIVNAAFRNGGVNNGYVEEASIESTFDNNGTMNNVWVSGTRNGVLNANLGSSINNLYLADGATVNVAIAERGNSDTARINSIIGSNLGIVTGNYGDTQSATLELIIGNSANDVETIASSVTNVNLNIKENALYDFKGSGVVDGKYIGGDIEIIKKEKEEIKENTGSSENQANVIDAVASAIISGTSSNETFNKLSESIGALLQSSNKEDVKKALDAITALAPEVAPAIQQTSVEIANQVFGAVGSRLSGGSVSTGGVGKSSGDGVSERGAMWVQGLHNTTKLDETSESSGFDAKTNGLALGFEKNISKSVKTGIGYAYGQTEIDGFMRSTDVDTHTAILYGEYKPSNWFLNGVATYSWSDYSENKDVAGTNVTADYNAQTVGLQLMTGYEIIANRIGITPEVGLRYVHIEQDTYTDSVGQEVSSSDSDILTGVIGTRFNTTWKLGRGSYITPELRFAATYDMLNDDTTSTVTLGNGSSYTVNGKALDRFGYEIGAGITAEINDVMELSVGYEGKFKENYSDHSGLFNAKYKF